MWITLWLIYLGRSLSLYLPFFAVERIFSRNRPAPNPIPYWWFRVFFLFILRATTFFVIFLTIANPDYFSRWSFAGLANLRAFWQSTSLWLAVPAVILIYTFAQYWIHRPGTEFLRSGDGATSCTIAPTRFELALSYYVQPLDIIVTQGTLCFVFIFAGLSPDDFILTSIAHGILDASQHFNVKTPRWLGYFIFRPEQHGLHHFAHNFNFGIITLWDLVFRTFRNPAEQPVRFGFSKEADRQFWKVFFGWRIFSE